MITVSTRRISDGEFPASFGSKNEFITALCANDRAATLLSVLEVGRLPESLDIVSLLSPDGNIYQSCPGRVPGGCADLGLLISWPGCSWEVAKGRNVDASSFSNLVEIMELAHINRARAQQIVNEMMDKGIFGDSRGMIVYLVPSLALERPPVLLVHDRETDAAIAIELCEAAPTFLVEEPRPAIGDFDHAPSYW